jgi:surface protein
MKKLIIILTILTGLVSCQSKVVSKITIKCQEDVKVGSVIEVDGESYKVVDEIMLKEMIANNDDITYICTSKITDMKEMFSGSEFNGDISNWDVSNVTDMKEMFYNSQFNGDISRWDVSSVRWIDGIFNRSQFNGDISNWDVSNVENMNEMFTKSKFNGDISKWDVSSVTNMNDMFYESNFNQPIGSWDVSNVTHMNWMFNKSQFNGDISKWDVSSVTNMIDMFSNSQFNGDISNWVNKPVINNIKSVCKKVAMDYLNNLNLSNILWLHDEGYQGGVCTGKPNQYCGRVKKFHNGQYWTYDIVVFVEWNYNGECKVTGTWDNL